MKEFEYVFQWANKASEQFLKDFMYVEHTVFGGFDRNLVNRKHINNPYGPSLITVVYLDGKPVAADTMMRNDINGRLAYESSDTCVLEECRGKGVFTKLTKFEIEALEPDSIIYGFPNSNSFPGYVKMGWTVRYKMYPTLFISRKRYNKEHPAIIDKPYAAWLAQSSSDYRYYKVCSDYYLVKFTSKKRLRMIGRLSKDAIYLFKPASRWKPIIYNSAKKRFYHKDVYHGSLITYGNPQIHIPYWKSDGFIN